MKMIGIASQLYDAVGSGVFTLRPESKITARTRRVSRTKTLDGGVVFTDGGYTDGDRNFTAIVEYEDSSWVLIRHLLEDCTLVVVSILEGCYLATLGAASLDKANIKISILLKEKLS